MRLTLPLAIFKLSTISKPVHTFSPNNIAPSFVATTSIPLHSKWRGKTCPHSNLKIAPVAQTVSPVVRLYLSKEFSSSNSDIAQPELNEDKSENGNNYSDTFQEYLERMEALSFLSSMDDEAITRATDLFEEMLEQFLSGDDETLRPTTEIYNLLMTAHARSDDPKGAARAEHVLNRMESADDEYVEEVGARPDEGSYLAVMDGYARRSRPVDAQRIFRRLCDRSEARAGGGGGASARAYNSLMGAWIRSRSRTAEREVLSIFHDMMNEYRQEGGGGGGDDDDDEIRRRMKPNGKTFVLVITAIASSFDRNDDECVARARDVYEMMETLYRESDGNDETLKPDKRVWSALIKVYANHARVTGTAREADDLLSKMIVAWRDRAQDPDRDDSSKTMPDLSCFINCINAWARSAEEGRLRRARDLLVAADEIYQQTKDSRIKPNTRLYNAVINAVSRSSEEDKAVVAAGLLNELKQRRLDDNDEHLIPTVRTYNLVLSACAFTSSEDEQVRRDAFRVAVDTLNQLRSRDEDMVNPDHVSYGMFLSSVRALLPRNVKRDQLVKSVFRKCCQDGLVSDFVVDGVKELLPENVWEEISTLGIKEEKEKEWCRNVNSKEGS